MLTYRQTPYQTYLIAQQSKPKIKPFSAHNEDGSEQNLQRYVGTRNLESMAAYRLTGIVLPPRGQTPEYTYPTSAPTNPTPTAPAATYPTTVEDSTPDTSNDITSETVKPMPAPRSRTTIAVGEEVILTHKKRHVNWTTTAGILSDAIDHTIKFTAPDIPKKVTITGRRSSITFDVIAPEGVFMERKGSTGVIHTQNRPDSGLNLQVYLQPDTVNFYKVQYHEVNVAAIGEGEYQSLNGKPHDEHPKVMYLSDTVVSQKGTKVANGGDCVYSGDPGSTPPFKKGSITFDIPYEYKVGWGTFYPFATVTQESTLDSDGSALKSSKANASGETTVASPTVINMECPYNI